MKGIELWHIVKRPLVSAALRIVVSLLAAFGLADLAGVEPVELLAGL